MLGNTARLGWLRSFHTQPFRPGKHHCDFRAAFRSSGHHMTASFKAYPRIAISTMSSSSLYNALAEIPVPVGGQFIGSGSNANAVELVFSVRDHDLNIKKTLVKTIGGLNSAQPIPSPAIHVDSSQIASLHSPSGTKRVVLRETKDNKRYVEVWAETTKTASLEVTDIHDGFYVDEYLGSLSFSPSEDAVVYTAEGRPSSDAFAKFRYRPDFGEGLGGKRRPTTFVFRFSDENTSVLHQLSTSIDIRLGQFVFSETPGVMYATSYELQVDGRLLGIKGCFNRATGVCKVELDGAATENEDKKIWEQPCSVTKLSDAAISARSPRLLPSQEVVYLACESGGPHVATSAVYSVQTDGSTKELLGISQGFEEDGFPGLYPAYNFPASPYLSDVGALVVHSHVRSRTELVFLSVDGSRRKIWADGDLYSYSVLATDGRSRVLCSRSSASVPYEIGVLTVEDLDNITWTTVDKPYLSDNVSKKLSTIETSIHDVPQRSPTKMVVVRSTEHTENGTVPPCILSPHGGPHATVTTAFSAATTALVLEGYTIAFPNYTGSLGYGDAAVQSLIGRCGRLDVDDCVGALDRLIALGLAEDGPGRVFVMGGSHGGFLSAHLIGQFPDRFSGAVMRNPVITCETSTTDIPDWYFAEFGLKYPIRSSAPNTPEATTSTAQRPPLMTGKTFAELEKASPIYYVDHVKAPVLLMVGLADRRVAPTHGLEYYHALTARKQVVDLLTFEGESHPLDGVEASRVGWEAGRDWFKAHGNRQ